MLIYEVRLIISSDILRSYDEWLQDHVKEMLGFEGFCGAKIYSEQSHGEAPEHIRCVHFTVVSQSSLDHYLHFHAERMREKAINQFGSKFTVDRRVLREKTRFAAS
ncbi:DUF4286 family protein [Marinibactrum halimedae]|uniref:DUF4286 family protein n=1 Tax=Marinibactrum halimedae TaxID=1444977 RepID=A0AA37TA19_9GAMM|nr:DUF4286 family protein [Marinibactrum halimedae]MCD9457494.1 DUF4286 family protein [Marinibactrum halimedae]GLS25452.1 hypothetical protein GCM10007877_11660 [Marinibactrum halimedae]